MTYDFSGGTGRVSGNYFNVGGFQGSVIDVNYPYPAANVDASLNGTAANGFGNLGNIGASGTFEITYGYGGTMYGFGGTIVDGWRVH